jgi:hypothetical protein
MAKWQANFDARSAAILDVIYRIFSNAYLDSKWRTIFHDVFSIFANSKLVTN